MLSVQSKLSCTLVSALCTPPQCSLRHSQNTGNSRNSLQLGEGDGDHFLRGQLLASDDEFRPHHPGTGEQSAAYVGPQLQAAGSTQAGPLLSLLFSLYLDQSRAIPGHGDMTLTQAQHEYKHQAPALTYNAPPPTQRNAFL